MLLTRWRRFRRQPRLRYLSAGLIVAAAALAANAGATTSWQIGDVFAGIGNGQYRVYSNAGTARETISDGSAGFTTGCSFNPSLDKLYTTNFSGGNVVVYDNASPHAVAQTINTAVRGGAGPESIVFASNGDFYVGHADGNRDIQRYDSAGVYQQGYDVAVESPGRGSDWIDLAADQKTMFYTSEGRRVMRYDVSTSTQLADFALLPGARGSFIAFALRLLPPGDGSGGLLVADSANVKRLDGTGAVVQTYDVLGNDNWFALNLDPNGTSFWAGDYGTSRFFRFNIGTGAVEVGPIVAGGTLFGLCLKGELTAAVGSIGLTPSTAQNEVGTSHSVRATVTVAGSPVPAELVSFSVTAGPNAGQTSDAGECSVNTDCTTDANGQVSWTYTSNGSAGTDTIRACFDDSGTTKCATASKEWIDTNAPPSVDAGGDASGDEGSAIPLDATVGDADGDTVTTQWTYEPLFGVDAGATCSFADESAVDTTITCSDDGMYTVTLTGDDGSNEPVSDSATVTVRNVPPDIASVAGPVDPVPVNTAVTITTSFTDPGTNDTHTCTLAWGDGTVSAGTVTGGSCTAGHAYVTPGLYTVTVTVTDDDLGSDTAIYRYVVVYDPAAGFVTGGGRITSPAGAYVADPTLTGRASFGFVSKYKHGASVPQGSTEFQFRAGDLNFHSTAYDWLVVAGPKAQYTGSGTVNGSGSYGFMLTANDGQRAGGGGVDRLRITIWDKTTGLVVYDNQLGSPDDEAASGAIDGGSIVIHTART